MKLCILYYTNENSDRCPLPCFEAANTVHIRSTCILSISGFADTGLMAEKCTYLQIGLCFILKSGDRGSPSRSSGSLVLQWESNPNSQPMEKVLPFSLLRGKTLELKYFTSILSYTLHRAGMYVTIALISPLTIDSGQLPKYIEIFIRFYGTCYFSSGSRLPAKGQDFRNMAGTAPLLPGSSKARIYQMKQHECGLVWHEPLPHPFPQWHWSGVPRDPL